MSKPVSMQNLIVVMQVAASVVLLVGAGLFTRTLWQASRVQLGLDPDHTVAASTDRIRQGYNKTASAGLLDPLLDSMRAQPGVQSAALATSLPLQGGMGTVVAPEGHQPASGEEDWVQVIMASPGYFNTVGIPMLSGRDFTDRKSTRLNSSHLVISYAVFCLKKKSYLGFVAAMRLCLHVA